MNIKRISLFILVIMLTCIRPYSADAQVQIQGPRNAEDVYSGVVYGPIDPTDTLWRIASRYKQDSNFSVYQTMLAIYELNPQAFENQNFNTMVNGAILQLPSDRYIARMSLQRAKAKAEADDRAFGRPNSVQPTNDAGKIPSENLKPEIPLVNQEDLSNTQRQLQNQLNALNRQQNTQFGAIKDQVSSSIDSVQALLDENRRLYERLDQVNTDIADLRNKVEGEVQGQIDEQLSLQKELIALVKDAQQRQLDKESESILTKLTSSTGIILLTTGFTLVVLIGLAIWALRKPAASNAAPVESKTNTKASSDIVDDELVIGEIDDAASAEADELMAALEAELPDDDDTDDILGEQLEDGLDEIQVDDNVDDFGDLDDEMLVPNATSNDSESNSSEASGIEEVSFDADAISLDEDELGNESIDLSDDDEILDTSTDENKDITDATDLEELDLGDDLDDEIEASENDETASTAENGKQNESADDAELVLDGLPSEEDDGTPEGVDLNEDGEIDENTIEQIEQQIQQKDKEINQLTDDILADIDNAVDEPDDSDVAAEESEDKSEEDTEFDALTDIDDILDATEADDLTTDNAGNDETAITQTPAEESGSVTDLADEILADIESELDGSVDDESDKGEEGNSGNDMPSMDTSVTNAPETEGDESIDPDDILAELGVDAAVDNDNSAPVLDVINDDNDEDDNNHTVQTSESAIELADELINELSEDDKASEELDSLLDEFTEQENNTLVEDNAEIEEPLNAIEDAIDLGEEAEPIDLIDSLADELLDELTEENGAKDELDELLEEMGADDADDEENHELIDELLEDIPSFTAEISASDAEELNSDIDSTDIDSTNVSEDITDSSNKVSDKVDTEESADTDDDLLADLPGLDDWLDEDSEAVARSDVETSHDTEQANVENDDLSVIAESDFDSLLAGIEDSGDDDVDDALNSSVLEDTKDTDSIRKDVDAAGLDLDALMSEGQDATSNSDEIEDFVDVDDLLNESETAQPKSDNDLQLDLNSSLDRLIDSEEDMSISNSSEELMDQSSNLDLAQVYIDMEDFDAAREVLMEVTKSNNGALKEEAEELLSRIEGK
ncbi:FimV/HubP family polar landmark protein [Agaribacter marinus]|nr:FimV/HubP family polar landmark protein [Agaribacter marinus]